MTICVTLLQIRWRRFLQSIIEEKRLAEHLLKPELPSKHGCFSVDIIESPLQEKSTEEVFERIREFSRTSFSWPEAELQGLALNAKFLNKVINYFKGDPSSPEVECIKSGDKMRRAFYNIYPKKGATMEDLKAKWEQRFNVTLRKGHKGIYDVRTVRRLASLSHKIQVTFPSINVREVADIKHPTPRRNRPSSCHRQLNQRPRKRRGA